MTTFALEQAIRSDASKDPERILRIVACDPACGCGVFLTEAACLLATQYAGRLFERPPTPAQVFAVMPTVVLRCIYGIDIDPVAVELARIAGVSGDGRHRPSGGTDPPHHLRQHAGWRFASGDGGPSPMTWPAKPAACPLSDPRRATIGDPRG
jgi:hypothetical protein